ncbi:MULTISPECIES: hypothetical protein [Paenibacillus]|nr:MULTISPECIES: hypothetical protein [Paenibacillus]
MNTKVLFSASLLWFGLLIGCTPQAAVELNRSTGLSASNPADQAIEKDEVSSGAETPSKLASQFPKSILTASTELDSVKDTPSVRAETVTEQGTLVMISNGWEELGHLVVSSNYGREGDKTFQSDYSVIYRQGKENRVLLELPALMFARPDDEKLSFERVRFKEADVYVLTPQYKTGHGVEGYLFAVDQRSGKAFPLQIVSNGHVFHTLVYSEINPFPHVENDKLVVYPPAGAGGDPIGKIQYRLDLDKKQLISE